MFFRFAGAYKFRYVYQMAFASGLLWSIFVMKNLNYNVIHYLERKRTKGTLFIFHACSDKQKKIRWFHTKTRSFPALPYSRPWTSTKVSSSSKHWAICWPHAFVGRSCFHKLECALKSPPMMKLFWEKKVD